MAESSDLTAVPADDIAGLVQAIATEPGRHIPVPGTMNFRDVGGYPADGGTISWRKLFRSDVLLRSDEAGGLTAAAAQILGPLGLRTVVDLRTGSETQLARSGLDDLHGAMTMHVSLIQDFAEMSAADRERALLLELGDFYDFIIDRRGAPIGAAIRSLARPGGVPGLVHCTAGKDRTGIVVALTLSALGVPDHFIAADYALTSLYLDVGSTPVIGQVLADSGLEQELTEALLASPPELIVRTLDRARARAGSVEGYLADCGVSADDLSSLRAALVTTAPGEPVTGDRHVGTGG